MLTANGKSCLDDGATNLKNSKDCLGALGYIENLLPSESIFWQPIEIDKHDQPKGCQLVNDYELVWNNHKTGGNRFPNNRRGVCAVGKYL